MSIYSKIIEAYLHALEQSDTGRLLELFHRDATVHSPLYGSVPAREFYQQLEQDSNQSTISDIQVFTGEERRAAAVRFQYTWELATGKQVTFDCVDIFSFGEDDLISSLQIIYDTWHVRPEFSNISKKTGVRQSRWFDRKFTSIDDNGLLTGIIVRLEGTALRLAEKVKALSREQLMIKSDDKWSILEEIGHLGDLESLWLGRIDDFMQGREILREADLSNRKTHTANHNSSTAAVLIDTFARQRRVLTRTIRELKDDDLERISLHPRLKTPMRVVDLAYFIAEHDDHHLARITSAAGR